MQENERDKVQAWGCHTFTAYIHWPNIYHPWRISVYHSEGRVTGLVSHPIISYHKLLIPSDPVNEY